MVLIAATIALVTYALVWLGTGFILWEITSTATSRALRLAGVAAAGLALAIGLNVLVFEALGPSARLVTWVLSVLASIVLLMPGYYICHVLLRSVRLTVPARVGATAGLIAVTVLAFSPAPPQTIGHSEAEYNQAAAVALEVAEYALDKSPAGQLFVHDMRAIQVSPLAEGFCQSGQLEYEATVRLYTVFGIPGQDVRVRCGTSYEFL